MLYNDLRDFGEWLRQAKAESEVTNISMGRYLKMSKCTFSRYCRGIQQPSLETVVRILDALGYNLVITKEQEALCRKNGDDSNE